MRISPQRWAEIEPHFDAVIELDEAARDAYLADLDSRDAALADDLRGLLRERAGDLADLPARAADLLHAAGSERGGAPDLADRRIGPWRVVRVVARGGMSVVYLGERADGKFDQQVAVKVMHWTGGARAMERFRLEQQTLARLAHPAITRIFDSGVTEDGLPYFVMEYVDGAPITRAAARRGLDLRERLRLFVRLCGAVHGAHQRLVVHRDLKPDNVLMTRDGHVKVLDFGIAKWLTGEEDTAALTRHGESLLTPQYASPEQFLDQPVTTATDVYALGLLLYELLAGRPPYELAGKTLTEQRRLVCEQEPQRLSASADDAHTRRQLHGDLDTICAKALQKDPARRYDSAAALADDLRRHLDGLPVLAAPDSAAYRASRFVRRHRVSVTVAALAALGLVAAAVTTAWQAGIAARERDRARAEAARSEEIVEFLVGALEQANPYADDGGSVTIREALERTAERIDGELVDQPEVRARVYTTLARVFSHIGEVRRARGYGLQAIRLADSVFGASSVMAASARLQTSRVVAQSSPESALVIEREAIADLEPLRDRDARLMLANVLEDHALHVEQVVSRDSGLILHRRALEIRESLLDDPHSDLARSWHHIASSQSSLGDPAAGASFANAARLWKATFGADHPNYASTLNNWAIWLANNGEPDSAEVIYREALAISRRRLGSDGSGLALPLNNIGQLALQRGRIDSARAYLAEAAGLLRGGEGSVTPLAATMLNLGLAAFLQGDYAAAEANYREGRALFAGRFGDGHEFVAIADAYVGRALWMQGRPAEAERLLLRAMKVFERDRPQLASRLVAARTWCGRMWLESDPERGEAMLRSAVELARDLPEHSPERGEAMVALGAHLKAQGRMEEGTELVRTGCMSLIAAHGESHPMTRWAVAALGSGSTL